MLFTSTTKTIQISIQIDTARCKGQWHAIPNLARRYIRHNPQGAALEQIILAETSLARLGQTKKPWDPKQIRTIQDQLQSVFELTDDTSEELKESAKVVLARLFFGCQEYDQVLALLDGVSILNAQSSGYSFILYYQSIAIKAMSLEKIGNLEASLPLYEYVMRLLDDQQLTKDLTLVEWAEQVLYRANLLIANPTLSIKIDQASQLEFLRSYHKVTGMQPLTWQTERRLGITFLMIKLLSKLYKSGEYTPPTLLDTNGLNDAQDDRKAFVEEMTQLYTICEQMLQATVVVTKSDESNPLILEMVELLALDMDWIADTTENWWGYKEVLERASEKTFNSPTILRLLFLTLFRLGEYEEAQQSLQSYLQVVGLISYEHLENQNDGNAPVQDIQGRYSPLPQSTTVSSTTIKRGQHKTPIDQDVYSNVDGESVVNQLSVLVKSIEMFCKEPSKGIKAMEMAELALLLVQSSAAVNLDTKQRSEVYRLSGVAYGLLASQTIDSEFRPIYHKKALDLLQQANTILPDSWETYYCLAYQQAEMRNIDHAIQLIQQSLKLNAHYIPSWHLLTLALSCPGQKDYCKALTVASTGLALWNDGLDLPADYEQHGQYLLLKMTHSKILGTLNGLEKKALEQHPDLFNLYMKWQAQGPSNDFVDMFLGEGSIGVGTLWYGRLFYGDDNGNDMAPRKPATSGSLGNISYITPSTTTTSIPHPASSNSTSLPSPVIKPSKSSRPRSASSSTLSHPFASTNGVDNSTYDSASIMTSTIQHMNNGDGANSHGLDDNKTHTISSQRSPILRKHASNSMLRVPGSNQSSHHWHGIHLFPSRSASRRQASIQTNHVAPISINGSISNESISKKSVYGNEDTVSRYNSEYSIQSGASSGIGGNHATPSIHDSITTTTSAISLWTSLPSLLIPQKQTVAPTTRDYLRNQQKHSRLCELWLMAGEWYFALSEWEEALKAISEAEIVCPNHPGVWHLLGKINYNKSMYSTTTGTSTTSKNDTGMMGEKQQQQQQQQRLAVSSSAIQFFEKGLLIRPGHVGCQLELAKLYMEQQEICLAEGILDSTTQGFGWNSPEAWYLLGTIYQLTGRKQQAKEYLLYALELESSCPIQPFTILPRNI